MFDETQKKRQGKRYLRAKGPLVFHAWYTPLTSSMGSLGKISRKEMHFNDDKFAGCQSTLW
jgi:hypothetical protein